MRKAIVIASLCLAWCDFCGCKSTSKNLNVVPSVSLTDEMSLEELRAKYALLRKQNLNDCMSGTPEHIRNNQALCEQERTQMAPLGNALMAEELKAAQQTNP